MFLPRSAERRTTSSTSAQHNRLFTRDFFAVARAALRPGGLFGLPLGGHAQYAGRERRRLHSSRITSYNVCYTKLLRHRPPTTTPRKASAPTVAVRMRLRRRARLAVRVMAKDRWEDAASYELFMGRWRNNFV